MSADRRTWPQVKFSQTQLGAGVNSQGAAIPGGLDLTTPNLKLAPGALRDVMNYEVAPSGGYSRIDGYERVDGQPAPSEAVVTLVQFDEFLNVPKVGQVVRQPVTGASGLVAAVVQSPVPYLVLTDISGAFDYSDVVIQNPGHE